MIPYSTFTLGNGLRVVHSCDPQSAMCVLCLLYDTGARDEQPDLTGVAHLFEHLMFGGSQHVASFDAVLEAAGGNSNAATGNDFTIFYDILPAQNIETAFFLESDRMLALDFSPKTLDVQKHVVVEEFKQVCLNRPYGCLMHELRPLLYPSHPYRWPVIGIDPSHIEKVTLDDVRRWFYSHYAPNNAVLSLVGNISLERARELAEKWFGPIPRRDVAVRSLPDDPWPTVEQCIEVVDDVPQTAIAVAYRMAARDEKGYLEADAITDILAAGDSSRMYRNLVLGTDLFSVARASIAGSEHSGFLLLYGQITSNTDADIERAKSMLIAEAKALAEEGNVTPYELERTKNRYESTFTFHNIALLSRAINLAESIHHGTDINQTVARYRSLTLGDIASTAREIFITHAPAIVVYRASAKEAPQPPKGGSGFVSPQKK